MINNCKGFIGAKRAEYSQIVSHCSIEWMRRVSKSGAVEDRGRKVALRGGFSGTRRRSVAKRIRGNCCIPKQKLPLHHRRILAIREEYSFRLVDPVIIVKTDIVRKCWLGEHLFHHDRYLTTRSAERTVITWPPV